MSETSHKRNERRFRRPGLIEILAIGAITTAAFVLVTEDRSKEKLPKLDAISQKSGVGNQNFKLKVEPAKNFGIGDHKLVVTIRLDCVKNDNNVASVDVEGINAPFEAFRCGESEPNVLDISPKNSLYSSKTIAVDVGTNKPELHWTVGAETQK